SLGLVSELPACYTAEGFRGLLERYGPLWIAALTPDKHIRVVTGMYSDGTNTFVRITDPIDRDVGTPGSPGAPKGSHTTGARYIMTYEALTAEYEAAGRIVPAGTMQILHCTAADVALRLPNRTDGTTAGYAQSLGRFEPSRPVRIGQPQQTRAMDAENECFSINWDDVELIAQPTDMGCWATSAAMVVGWRDRQSVDPRSLAKSCPIPADAMDNGVTPEQFAELANSLNLISEPPACYTAEGFRQILERSGPLWVAGISPGRHIRVVTGMYGDGTDIYVRITDPWDRVVGTPGKPGPIPNTHNTGSRYIMTYAAFAAEYEAAGAVVPAGTMQILHARPEDIADRTPSRTIGNVPGYAQGLAARAFDAPMLASLQFSATAWPASAPETLTRECDEVLPEDQKVAYWKGLLDSLVGPQTAAKLRDLPAVAKDRGWTVVVGAGATPGVALVSSIGSGLVIDSSSQPYTFGIGRLDGGSPPDPFEPKNMAAVTDGKPQITIVEGDTRALMRFGLVCAFRTQDRRVRNGAAILDPAGNFVGATFQLEVNGLKAEDILDAVKVGYAQTPAKYGMFSKPLGLAQGRTRSVVRPLGDDPAPGTTVSRVQKDQGGVKFDLAQLSGMVQPQTAPMVAINTPLPGR
ncbi:MAG TPA: papain-like cysteine protease family protein, partial [Phenylobacterium sp.]